MFAAPNGGIGVGVSSGAEVGVVVTVSAGIRVGADVGVWAGVVGVGVTSSVGVAAGVGISVGTREGVAVGVSNTTGAGRGVEKNTGVTAALEVGSTTDVPTTVSGGAVRTGDDSDLSQAASSNNVEPINRGSNEVFTMSQYYIAPLMGHPIAS